jgi:serine/threonine-protein kinase RsbW
MNIDLMLSLPRDASTIGLVRHVARCALVELGATDDTVADVELALTEACANVVKHSMADDEYDVHFELDGRECRIRVVDTGHGFDSDSLDIDGAEPSAEQGRGIGLMHALMDGVHFESQPRQGTIVHLVKTVDVEPGSPLDRLDRAEKGSG